MAEVKARATLDSSGFRAGMTGMKKEVQGFGKQLGNVKGLLAGAFSIGAIVAMGRAAISLGSTITDLARQAGLTTDEFQALEVAAIRAGTAPEMIRQAMNKLSIELANAKTGQQTYLDKWEDIGVKGSAVMRLDLIGALEEVSRAMTENEASSKEYGTALEMLGTRSGSQLIEVLEQINKVGMRGLIEDAKRAGDVIDNSVLVSLDAMEDRIQAISRRAKGWLGQLMTGVASTFEFLGKAYARFEQAGGGGLNPFKNIKAAWNVVSKGEFVDVLDEMAQLQAEAEQSSADKLRRGNGPPVDDPDTIAALKELAALSVKLADAREKLAESQMNTNELLSTEEAKLSRLVDLADKLKEGSVDQLQVLVDIANKEREIIGLKERQTKEVEQAAKEAQSQADKITDAREDLLDIASGGKIGSIPVDTDQLARIGGFTGGQVPDAARAADRQIAILEQLKEFTQKLPEDIAAALAPELAQLGGLQ